LPLELFVLRRKNYAELRDLVSEREVRENEPEGFPLVCLIWVGHPGNIWSPHALLNLTIEVLLTLHTVALLLYRSLSIAVRRVARWPAY
jgi:hypothetical protein